MLMVEVYSFFDKKYTKILVHIRKCCIFAIELNYIGMARNIIVTVMK